MYRLRLVWNLSKNGASDDLVSIFLYCRAICSKIDAVPWQKYKTRGAFRYLFLLLYEHLYDFYIACAQNCRQILNP